MNYCIVDANGIIENIIACEDDVTAAGFGAVPSYDGAAIGQAYDSPAPDPAPEPEPTADEVLNALLGVNEE